MDRELPNRMRAHRIARGLRLQDLADRLNCGTSQISDLELGKRQLTYHWMQRVAKVLKIQPDDLLLEKHTKNPLTVEERDIISRYRDSSPEDRAKIFQMVRILTNRRT